MYSQDPYPLFACGRIIANAAYEHSRNINAPEELTGIAAMTAAAAAVQDSFDVKRPDLLPSPTSVLVFCTAESGESKSIASKIFLSSHEAMEAQMEAQAQKSHDFEAAEMVWKAELESLRCDLRELIEKEKSTEQIRVDIAQHLSAKPIKQPRVRLLHDKVTPVALRRGLAAWPSTLIFSLDGGHVLNGSIGADNDLFNSAWDGDPIRADTAAASYTARDPRLSALIFVQPLPTLRYFKRRGEEAQSTGFLARTDWAYLSPTKGTREPYAGPKVHEAMGAYHARTTSLLEERIRTRLAGDASRRSMGFTEDGAAYFRDLYQRTRRMSAPGGELQAVGGYAAKIAERIARYACVIHVFNDLPGLIGPETLAQAELIIKWHSRQFLKLLTLTSPQTEAWQDAQMLENLVVNAVHRGQFVRMADLQILCPHNWARQRRTRALQTLCESGRARVERWRNVKYIWLSTIPPVSLTFLSPSSGQPSRGF